jgi:hypothetical protein
MSTLNERISAKQAELVAARDVLVDLTAKADDGQDDTAATAMAEQVQTVEKLTADLDGLKSAESAISKSIARTPASAGIISSTPKHKGENDLVKAALVTFEAHFKRVPVMQIAEERYGNDEAAKLVIATTVKGAQNPAMTTVAGYAAELVRDGYGQFMDLLKPESVLPRLSLNNFSFDGYQSIKIPMRTGSATSNPNLAGAFRAEGAPIRVGALSLGSMTLTPKSLGVIGTFSMELFERSTPNIEQVIRGAMISDTAVALDNAFLGNAAGTATQPAGILNAIGAGNTAASAGTTSANIVADLRGRMQAMAGANMGKRPQWIMNPARAWGLQLALTAAGTPLFPEMANGTLLGIPVITSTTVPAATVYLVDGAEVFFAGGAPTFMGSDVATIHEEDTTPLPIVGAAKTDVANPVRSLFQTNSAALRCMWNIDWAVARPGAVQALTAVAW